MMESMDNDLITFFTACLDQDEADAPSVHLSDCSCVLDRSAGSCDCGYPARARRDIAAKRALIGQYQRLLEQQVRHAAALAEWEADIAEEERTGTWSGAGNPGTRSHALGREGDLLLSMIPILRNLLLANAAAYSHYPDYRQEWTP
jgi:hypothetical protein